MCKHLKPQKVEEGYNSDAPGGESEGCVALVPSASLLHFELEAVHKLNYSDIFFCSSTGEATEGGGGLRSRCAWV